VPLEHRRVRPFKHHLFDSEAINDGCHDVSAPGVDVFDNSLALDHDDIGTGIERALSLRDKPTKVLGALGFEFFGRGTAPGSLWWMTFWLMSALSKPRRRSCFAMMPSVWICAYDLRDLGQMQIDGAYQRSEWILRERLVMMTPSRDWRGD
jgi:hypothetical protein